AAEDEDEESLAKRNPGDATSLPACPVRKKRRPTQNEAAVAQFQRPLYWFPTHAIEQKAKRQHCIVIRDVFYRSRKEAEKARIFVERQRRR
ncbi:MAG TPA: hypothetical protein VGB09_13330, partial [Candidatus Binatia bacterium]